MKKIFLIIASLWALASNAQIINGDLNHNDSLDVCDVTLLIDGYLTGDKEWISTEVDHYAVQNSMVAGTWYVSKTECLILNADGTTNYGDNYTYRFLPSQGRILFFNADDIPVAFLNVVYITENYLAILSAGDATPTIYTAQPPVQYVTRITLSDTSLELKPDAYERLTVTVTPSDADNVDVVWSSSDESVATVSNGFVLAVKDGTAIITAEAADGSGVKATCKVSVVSKVPVSSISLSETSLTLWSSAGKSVSATVYPSNATNRELTWSSSNTSVATVSSSGYITAQGSGTATITASATDGSGKKATCVVTVKSTSGTSNGHAWVDLGLTSGTKWATMNVGASSASGYGDYYAWGETTTRNVYSKSYYEYTSNPNAYSDNDMKLSKYCTNSSYGTVDNRTELTTSDDVAYYKWGSSWRIPSAAQMQELLDECTWTWTSQSGVNGYKVSSKVNSASIFLPAGGEKVQSSLSTQGQLGYYWTRTLASVDTSLSNWYAHTLYFYSGGTSYNNASRYLGINIRPVCQ